MEPKKTEDKKDKSWADFSSDEEDNAEPSYSSKSQPLAETPAPPPEQQPGPSDQSYPEEQPYDSREYYPRGRRSSRRSSRRRGAFRTPRYQYSSGKPSVLSPEEYINAIKTHSGPYSVKMISAPDGITEKSITEYYGISDFSLSNSKTKMNKNKYILTIKDKDSALKMFEKHLKTPEYDGHKFIMVYDPPEGNILEGEPKSSYKAKQSPSNEIANSGINFSMPLAFVNSSKSEGYVKKEGNPKAEGDKIENTVANASVVKEEEREQEGYYQPRRRNRGRYNNGGGSRYNSGNYYGRGKAEYYGGNTNYYYEEASENVVEEEYHPKSPYYVKKAPVVLPEKEDITKGSVKSPAIPKEVKMVDERRINRFAEFEKK